MKIEKHLNHNQRYDDWTAFILVYENEEYVQIDCGVYDSKDEALNVLNETGEELSKYESLESVKKEIDPYGDL